MGIRGPWAGQALELHPRVNAAYGQYRYIPLVQGINNKQELLRTLLQQKDGVPREAQSVWTSLPLPVTLTPHELVKPYRGIREPSRVLQPPLR